MVQKLTGSIKTRVLGNLEVMNAEPNSSEVLNVAHASLTRFGMEYILYSVKESIVKDMLYSKRRWPTDSIVTVPA